MMDAMDARRALQRAMLKTYDVSERTARASGASVAKRFRKLQFRAFMIVQCAVTAGLAWTVAAHLLKHPMPVFAPVAAIVSLGFSFGQRLSRAIEIGIGVAVGVFVGDLFVALFGTGAWQVVVVVAISMALATLVGARNLMITQAGVQSSIVVTLLPDPSQGLSRWTDALIGCALALIVTTIAPSSPLRRPRLLAAEALNEIASTLEACRDALESGDHEAAEQVLTRARNSEKRLSELDEANSEGMAVVRYSPFVHRHKEMMQSIAALYDPLDRLTRNLRVLARRVVVATLNDEKAPPGYLEMMTDLIDIIRSMAAQLYERRLPTGLQSRLLKLGRKTAVVPLAGSLSTIVVLAQIRSMLTDLLELSGCSYADARGLIPERH